MINYTRYIYITVFVYMLVIIYKHTVNILKYVIYVKIASTDWPIKLNRE